MSLHMSRLAAAWIATAWTFAFACANAAQAASQSAADAGRCAALATQAWPHASVQVAQWIAAGEFKASPGTLPRNATPGFDDLPAFCRVSGTITTSPTSAVRFEAWLPASTWNGKFLANGFAFFGGTMNPVPLANALRQGYATATTDLGGDGTISAAYLVGNAQALVDWNHRGWHETTVMAKALVKALYGKPATLAYWESCGGGTRQGLQEIARYPADYDALSAGGLSNDTTHFTFSQVWQWQATHASPTSLIPREGLVLLHAAALRACDAQDGREDGLISDPEHCRFDPAAVQCATLGASDCLSDAQVQAARAMYAPVSNPRTGERIAGPAMPGSELNWNATPSTSPGLFPDEFFRYLVFADRNWNYADRPVNLDGDVALANRPGLADISATQADLRPFFARGGKLLIYSGWADTAIPPLDTVRHVADIVRASGERNTHDSLRLFMIPGGGHCPAPAFANESNFFEPLPVITAWRERGQAPRQIEVVHKAAGVDDSRLVVYPHGELARARKAR
jgi:feruloyl esterase